MNSEASTSPSPVDCGTCDYCGLPLSTPSVANERSYCCFGCRFADGITQNSDNSTVQFGPSSAFGLSVFFTINVVMMTMALWSYVDSGESAFETALRNFLRYGAMTLSAPVLLLLGRPLFSHAITALRRSQFTTDLLLSVGVLAAFAVSAANTVRDSGHVYFEVGCVILVLVTLGRWLEASGRSTACQALEQLEQLVPRIVRRWSNGQGFEFPRDQVALGDQLRVIAGERIPLDGRILVGRAVVDEQFFTGESVPIEKQPGDTVLGGSLNLDGDFVFEVTAPHTGGALGRLVDAVRKARLTKGRYQLLSDTWSQWFFPSISAIAMAAFVYHGLRVDWEYGLLTALSVLLIACPCALALATPLAVWSALSTAAKRGVLFRSGEALESLAAIRAIRWDKTGTLTTGSPRVLRLICESTAKEQQLKSLALTLASASNHLFSKAIREFLAESQIDPSVIEVKTVAGCGLIAITSDRDRIYLGSISWLETSGQTWGSHLKSMMLSSITKNFPITAIARNGQIEGLFLLEEEIRSEARCVIDECKRLQIDQAVLTGDRLDRVSVLAETLGLPVYGQLMPEEKLAAIRTAKIQVGRVAMIGDGLNDAPALVAADVGIALGCGADVSRDSADICLLTSDLRLVPWAYQFSRRTVRTIQTNLAWSFGYNSVGVVIAACGQLHPAVATVLMVVSSLMVLSNSLRLSTEPNLTHINEESTGALSQLANPAAQSQSGATS